MLFRVLVSRTGTGALETPSHSLIVSLPLLGPGFSLSLSSSGHHAISHCGNCVCVCTTHEATGSSSRAPQQQPRMMAGMCRDSRWLKECKACHTHRRSRVTNARESGSIVYLWALTGFFEHSSAHRQSVWGQGLGPRASCWCAHVAGALRIKGQRHESSSCSLASSTAFLSQCMTCTQKERREEKKRRRGKKKKEGRKKDLRDQKVYKRRASDRSTRLLLRC